MEFDISYTSKEITPWGGMAFLKQMLQKIGFREVVEANKDLPESKSNRGYKTSTIIEGFITSIWCGAIRCTPFVGQNFSQFKVFIKVKRYFFIGSPSGACAGAVRR
jgi:hypothetical protein